MPLIHLRHAAPDGIFDRLTECYYDLWEGDSRPIRSDPAAEEDEDGRRIPESDPRLLADQQPAVSHSERSAPPPRRWPRRP
jgi:hypothetical protein